MTSPAVHFNPAVGFGRAHLNGIHTETIADMYWTDEDVEDEYGLSRHQLLVALWYEGLRGEPRHRKRWKVWARDVAGPALWDTRKLDASAVPLPATCSAA